MLTYWRGTSRQGIGTGEMVMLDQSYRVIHRIRTANGLRRLNVATNLLNNPLQPPLPPPPLG